MLLTVIGNLLVCCAVIIYKRLQTRTNMMLLSLAVSDLLMVISMAFNSTMLLRGEWLYSNTLCTIVSSLALTLCFISILHLCVLSIDRYIFIKKPFKHEQLMSQRTVMILMVFIWLIPSTVVNLPYADFDFRSSVFGCLKTTSHYNPSSSFFLVVVFVIFPFAILFYVYMYLFKTVRQHTRRINDVKTMDNCGQAAHTSLSLTIKREMKSLKTFALVIGVFLLCYTPFFVLGIYASSKGTDTISADVIWAVTWLAFCNSFCNPVVYSLRYKTFRESFRKILCSPQSLVSSQRSERSMMRPSVGRTNSNCDINPPFIIKTETLSSQQSLKT